MLHNLTKSTALETCMTRQHVIISFLAFGVMIAAMLISLGCQGDASNSGTPLYIKPGEDPFGAPNVKLVSIEVKPAGVNLAVGGLQKFRATARYNDGSSMEVTSKVEWYTENPAIGTFEAGTSKFMAQRPGVAVIRCRVRQSGGYAVSMAAFVNSFNPNLDNPPAVVLNPWLSSTPEGVVVSWDLNVTDSDLAGYNIYRTQVSTSHYSIEYDLTSLGHYATDHRLNERPILYPPYLDKTVISGWYYYRVTAEDLLGIQSAPSEEVSIFIPAK